MTSYRGFPACECLKAWLPVYEKMLRREGILAADESLRIYQLIGGATASAGTHSKGGAFDISDLVGTRDVAIARQMGADATWARTRAQGFTPHLHGVLRGCPHNSPARYQIDAVDAGFNGLGRGGRGGKDDGPRPLSGRTWQEGIEWAEKQMCRPRFTTANLRAKDGIDRGTRTYIDHLIQTNGRGLIAMQEYGRGLSSTRFRGVRYRRIPLSSLVLGKVGAHRAVARTWVKVDGVWVRVFNLHGLHNKTVGRAAHDAHLGALARHTRALTRKGRRWVVAGDFNESVTYSASRLGGKAHGVGIIGFVVSPGLRVTNEGTDAWGKRKGHTDHPAYWIDLAKESL